MRQSGFIVGLALALAACSGGGGYVTGDVHVAKGNGGLGVYAAIWQVPATPSNPNDPTSALIATPGGQAQFLGDLALGVTTSDSGDFKYTFHSIDRGLYIVGAFLDSGVNPQPDITADVHDIDFNNPVEVNPSSKDKATATRDLYLGQSAPDKGTISGTIHLSDRAAAVSTWVLVMTANPYTDGTAKIIIQQGVPSGTADVPFQIFNTPTTAMYVLALSDINRNGSLEFGSDLISLRPDNPITVSMDQQTAGNVDLWMDRQSDALGSIQGTVTLSAALPTTGLTLMLYSSDFSMYANANVVNVVNLTTTASDGTVAFQFPSVSSGQVYLFGLVRSTRISGSGTAFGQSEYDGTQTTPAAIPVTMAQPHVTGINFPVGVGLVSGSAQLTNMPSDLRQFWVMATMTHAGKIYLKGYDTVSVIPGTSAYTYEVFGLLDGQYDMSLVPDLTHTGSISDNLSNAKPGVPASVKISGGGRQGSDFKYTF